MIKDDYFGFIDYLYIHATHPLDKDGDIFNFHFPNGYGASIIKTSFSYSRMTDLWELAVFKKNESDNDWDICYDTSVTNDVLGNLTQAEVKHYLNEIFKFS